MSGKQCTTIKYLDISYFLQRKHTLQIPIRNVSPSNCIVNFTTKIPESLRKSTIRFRSYFCYKNINQSNTGGKQNGGSHKRGSEKEIQAYLIVSFDLIVLRFYGPVNPMGSCRARSVYLTTRLLGRLSPLSG